jgi:hypothetical protein
VEQEDAIPLDSILNAVSASYGLAFAPFPATMLPATKPLPSLPTDQIQNTQQNPMSEQIDRLSRSLDRGKASLVSCASRRLAKPDM